MTPRIFVVDVFAERPYSGNQLAVVLSDEPLDVQRMQSPRGGDQLLGDDFRNTSSKRMEVTWFASSLLPGR